jgi:electron-transferring-flavoprotein dehydrogenase
MKFLPLLTGLRVSVLSLCSEVVRWLGQKAEDLGVEIFPGFGGAKVVYGPSGDVHGVQVRGRRSGWRAGGAGALQVRCRLTADCWLAAVACWG